MILFIQNLLFTKTPYQLFYILVTLKKLLETSNMRMAGLYVHHTISDKMLTIPKTMLKML
jgi:hypothetical protein